MNRAKNLAAAFALLLVALTVGSGTPAASADTVCPQTTKAVFYTTDSTNLATRLGANKADCTQYFISITPTLSGPDTGKPRGGLPLTTIHNQGPQFHALAEIRLTQWDSCTDLNCWYAAGVNLHDAMTNPAVGYDPARDTWAINEVGSPSPSGLAKDVFNGTLHNGVDARQAFRAFVHGLYDGSSGQPMPGIVFAANAPQLAPDVADYTQKLTTWYSDAPFWEDIQQYVSTWAQETYADPRAWGVTGKSREERTPYLNDYFLHGIRFADQGNDATDAARAFLQRTYLSLANVVYPSTTGFPPDPGSLTGMLRFISAQTYAQRSSLGTRLGYAVLPTAGPANNATIETRVAAAVHDSQTDPIGACIATGESCDFDVTGASFTESWRPNTNEGGEVAVSLGSGVSVTFDGVSARGSTWFSSSPTDEAPTGWTAAGPTYDISTTAVTSGHVEVCLGAAGHVFLRSGDAWIDKTTSPGCGTADQLGKFALFTDPTPPVVVASVSGQLGKNDWHVGDVTVNWDVSDPQTAVSAEAGCDSVTIDQDTAGTTFTCVATSEGGTNSGQVTVKRDATPPDLTCTPAPPTWSATDVSIPCAASDATSDLADPADASFNLSTSVPPGTETANASTNSRNDVCDNAGNCVTAGPIDGIMVDKKGPSLDCGLAPTFLLNQAVATVFAAVTDAGSGVASPSTSAAADTSTPGSHSVDLMAADNVGNVTIASCRFSVGYALNGFGRPIANTPTVNTGKAGRTYPVKWQLQDANGGFISRLNAATRVVLQPTPCADFASDPDSTMTVTATGATSLRYDSDANQYVYNWATPSTAGCYTLFVQLDSGQTLHAYFQLS